MANEIEPVVETEATQTTETTTEPIVEAPGEGNKPDPKELTRQAYELRKAEAALKALQAENEGYKRRDEAKRQADLTEAQKLQEERDTLYREVETLKVASLRSKVGAEFKLPPALSSVLIGTDEESMRLHAGELAALLPKPRAGTNTDPARGEQTSGRVYTRAELQADPTLAASPEVRKAMMEGRIK